ncbi:MAG: bifunctional glutamate N-acetyltransferase/amino-acid acetyltransferase ArgJ [Hyphomicrobiales bacterium]
MAGIDQISPLAPEHFPDLLEISGVRLSAQKAGVKYRGRADVLVALFDEGTSVAGVFTRSKTASAPVEWCREKLPGGTARALIVNSGNANAFTGKHGVASVKAVAREAAKAAQCKQSEIFLASTGVIGEPLDPSRITKVLARGVKSAAADAWHDAAQAIMTTDTYPKGATTKVRLAGKTVTINGIAKGSGMIAPDMATMLSYVFTDADIPASVLQELLERATAKSFNCITVDGDTSTSDTLMAFATGAAGNESDFKSADDKRLRGFTKAFDAVVLDLAHQVVRDGEGAEKFVSISVTGAETDEAARAIGLAIANSPLVKTAIAGEDANWGRIVMAVGKSGEEANRDKLKIWIGGVLVASRGERHAAYRERQVVPHMKGRNIDIKVDAGTGNKGKSTVWTCDLTHRYIIINADYRS